MSDAIQGKYFEGGERLEMFPPLGRPMRMGSPEALEVGDKQRIIDAMNAGDSNTCLSYLRLVFQTHVEMFDLLFEWGLAWSGAAAIHLGPGEERRCTAFAFQRWSEAAGTLNDGEAGEAMIAALLPLLSERMAVPGAEQVFRDGKAAGHKAMAGDVGNVLLRRQSEILNSVESGTPHSALQPFEEYWNFVVTGHDALVQYSQSYPAALLDLFGQTLAEKCIHDSFSSCSFFEGLWHLGTSLNAAQIAAFLAEHLRAHFSGRGRHGTVRVEEESDCYRLIFDACGSGGAMRRRNSGGRGIELMPEATSATWNIAGRVPCYCSHCAFNELESMKRMGYPVLITAFELDPVKPCGWTVYKEPTLIPEEYFERLGFRKDALKFKST